MSLSLLSHLATLGLSKILHLLFFSLFIFNLHFCRCNFDHWFTCFSCMLTEFLLISHTSVVTFFSPLGSSSISLIQHAALGIPC
jgi:hypothetical protein